jgi:hypothetical protein
MLGRGYTKETGNGNATQFPENCHQPELNTELSGAIWGNGNATRRKTENLCFQATKHGSSSHSDVAARFPSVSCCLKLRWFLLRTRLGLDCNDQSFRHFFLALQGDFWNSYWNWARTTLSPASFSNQCLVTVHNMHGGANWLQRNLWNQFTEILVMQEHMCITWIVHLRLLRERCYIPPLYYHQ